MFCISENQDSVASSLKLLKTMNAHMDARGIMKMMHEYQVQNETFNTKQETVQQTMDETLAVEDETETTDETIAAVFEELGLDALQIATARVPVKAEVSVETLEQRLMRLRAQSER